MYYFQWTWINKEVIVEISCVLEEFEAIYRTLQENDKQELNNQQNFPLIG